MSSSHSRGSDEPLVFRPRRVGIPRVVIFSDKVSGKVHLKRGHPQNIDAKKKVAGFPCPEKFNRDHDRDQKNDPDQSDFDFYFSIKL
jgi:hypothetical protein